MPIWVPASHLYDGQGWPRGPELKPTLSWKPRYFQLLPSVHHWVQPVIRSNWNFNDNCQWSNQKRVHPFSSRNQCTSLIHHSRPLAQAWFPPYRSRKPWSCFDSWVHVKRACSKEFRQPGCIKPITFEGVVQWRGWRWRRWLRHGHGWDRWEPSPIWTIHDDEEADGRRGNGDLKGSLR